MRVASPFALASLIILACASPALAATGHVVRMVSDYEDMRMAFEPEVLRIEPGDYVIWINESDEEHDVVSFPDGYPRGARSFSSPIMTGTGDRFAHRFTVPGTYEYHCMPHLPMNMQGTIIVGRPSAYSEAHKPSAFELEVYRVRMLRWFDDEEVDFRIAQRQQRWHRSISPPESAGQEAENPMIGHRHGRKKHPGPT